MRVSCPYGHMSDVTRAHWIEDPRCRCAGGLTLAEPPQAYACLAPTALVEITDADRNEAAFVAALLADCGVPDA